jgi:hypothetical protein
VTAQVIALVIIFAVAVGVPEIETGMGDGTPVSFQYTPLNDESGAGGARICNSLTLRRAWGIVRAFLDGRG